MDFEQIVKQLNWLDKEQRKSKTVLENVDERFASLDASVAALSKQLKALSKQLTDISHSSSRVNQFEDILARQRVDIGKIIEENEKRAQRREKDAAKQIQVELKELKDFIAESTKDVAHNEDVKKKFKERADEIQRLNTNAADLKERIEGVLQNAQKVVDGQKMSDDARSQDLRRLTDIQGEITALRKRTEDQREKVILQDDKIKNIENRINELLTSEIERKQEQTEFLEKQNIAQHDRERYWKEWRDNVERFEKQAEELDEHAQALDETLRAAKKAQETYLELNAKLERRINEITEMQRLAEDRIRQEWITFKADDQKRWAGYTLSSEESIRDLRKDITKFGERIATAEEISQSVHDQLHQTADVTEKQLQDLMNIANEWKNAYERIMGHVKKGKK